MSQLRLTPELIGDLHQVEQIIQERTRARAIVTRMAGDHLTPTDTLRFHAALVLLAAQTANYELERAIHAATAVELIRAAVQTHNDLVNEAERRRGHPRVGPWPHGVALMVGDYLFALAAGEMSRCPEPRVITYLSEAVKRVTEGVLLPPAPLWPLEQAQAQHLERIGAMYAALVAAACRAGAAVAGADDGLIETLGRFGYDVGLALRLGDEVRDFADGNRHATPGATIRAGVITLPLIYAAASGDGRRLATALDGEDPDEQAWAVDEVRRYGLAPTRAEIARHANNAYSALTCLPSGPPREALAQVADYAIQRAI